MTGERTALALIDMQVDVVRGRWWTWWPEVDSVVEACSNLLDTCHEAGVLVVYTKVEYSADGSNTPQAIASGVAQPTEYLIEGTDGVEIIEALTPGPDDLVMTKNLVSAFSIAEFATRIDTGDIGRLLVAGLSAEGGVRATAEDSHRRGLRTVVVSDACAAFGEESYSRTMSQVLPALGQVLDLGATARLLHSS
jgi:nicotinamidase-related amidase